MSQDSSRKTRSSRLWISAGLIAVALVGLRLIWPEDVAVREGQQTLRIGYLPIAADLPLFVATEKDFFSQRGLDVQMVRFESSPLMGTAFVNGDLEAAASIAATTAFAIETRDPGRFRVFMVDANTPEAPLSAMLTLPSSGITRVEDLKGRTVGIFPGSNAALFFGLVLKKHGIDPRSDLTLVELPAGAQLQALAGGQIDALCTWEPLATQAVLDYGAINFHPAAIETEVLTPYNAGVWLLSPDYVARQPDASAMLVDGLEEALDYMRINPKDAKKTLVTYASIAPHVADKMECLRFWKLSEVQPDVFQRFADIVHDGGVISKAVDAPSLLLNSKNLSAQ